MLGHGNKEANKEPALPKLCPLYPDETLDDIDKSCTDVSGTCEGPNFFEEINEEEMLAVQNYLNQSHVVKELSISKILQVEFLPPSKSEALRFWAGEGPRPARSARVQLLVHRSQRQVHIGLRVWPLEPPAHHARIPVVGKVTETPWHNPFKLVNWDMYNFVTSDVYNRSLPLLPIINSLFPGADFADPSAVNFAHFGRNSPRNSAGPLKLDRDFVPPPAQCNAPCIVPSFQWPGWTVPDPKAPEGYRMMAVWAYSNQLNVTTRYEGWWLHSLHFIQWVYELSRDAPPHLHGLWMMGRFFATPELALRAWNDPVNKAWHEVHVQLPATDDQSLYSNFRKRPGKTRGSPQQPLGPLAYDPYGHRFSVSRNLVRWMGWSLEMGLAKRGPRFFDVRFKGERLAYEISFQEGSAGYGGPDIAINHVFFLDAQAYGLGYDASQLLYGVDCPSNAQLVDVPGRFGKPCLRCMCVFEHDTSLPILAHSFTVKSGSGAVRGTALYVRTRHKVGNYDYFHDLILHLDGTVHTTMHMTGYLTGTNYMPGLTERYASGPISHYFSGSIHDHTFNWKIDLDIGASSGANNSLQVTEVQPQVVDDPIFKGSQWFSKRLKVTSPTSEKHANWVFNPISPKQVVMVDEGSVNAWGATRGYTINPTLLHNPAINPSDPKLKATAWSKYNLAVTVHKEAEWTSTMDPDFLFPWNPVLDFDTFINDDEDVRGADLVAWVTSGVYHLVRAEDAPVTATTLGVAPGFILRPFNYHDENAGMDLPDLFTVTTNEPYDQRRPLIQDVMSSEERCMPQYEEQPLMDAGSDYDWWAYV